MAATGFESLNRMITQDRITRHYRVENALVETDVADFVASLDPYLGAFALAEYSAEEIDEEIGAYDLTVVWGKPTAPFIQEEDTTEFRFNFQMGGGKFKQSLQTINTYWDTAQLGFGAPDYGGAINVVIESGKLKVEGYDVHAPPEVFTLTYRTANITAAYQNLVLNICGTVNSLDYRGYAAGSLCLVRCTGGRDRSGVWSIEFGFGYIPNIVEADGYTIGNINKPGTGIITKDGFDLLWVLYRTSPDNAGKTIIQQPAAVYVERIFERTDFANLNLPN